MKLNLLNTEQVSKILHVSQTTLRNELYRDPSFPVVRVGKNYRVNYDSLIHWMSTRHFEVIHR